MEIDWEEFFKPEDFEFEREPATFMINPTLLCTIANAKLNKALAEAPTVYGHSTSKDDFLYSRGKKNLDCHSAKLVLVKELSKSQLRRIAVQKESE